MDRRAPEAVIAALAAELEASVAPAPEALRAPARHRRAIELARLVMRSHGHIEEKDRTGGT